MGKLDERIIQEEFEKAMKELTPGEWKDYIFSCLDMDWLRSVINAWSYDLKQDAIVEMKKIISRRIVQPLKPIIPLEEQ